MNLEFTCLFHKWFFTVYLAAKKKNVVTLPHIAQRKHASLGGNKEMSKTKKLPSRKKIALELLHRRLGHRSTILLLTGDTANDQDCIELSIDPDPFHTSSQISSMNKKDGYKIPLKPKSPFKWFLWTYFHQQHPNVRPVTQHFLTTF